jgi:ComF family protein
MDVRFVRRIIAPVVDFIYPRVCRICDAAMERDASVVCPDCWRLFTPVSEDHPVWREIHAKVCAEGMVDDLFSCYLFEKEGKLQEAIHLLKYGGVKSVGVGLGREIGARFLCKPLPVSVDLVAPVPLHRRKKRERGYNQSEYLCRGFAEVTGVPVMSRLLVRKKFTVSQTQLGVQERKENVEGAFMIAASSGRLVKGRTILLIDDVITTGATIGACAAVLRNAGAGHILAASVALAQ